MNRTEGRREKQSEWTGPKGRGKAVGMNRTEGRREKRSECTGLRGRGKGSRNEPDRGKGKWDSIRAGATAPGWAPRRTLRSPASPP